MGPSLVSTCSMRSLMFFSKSSTLFPISSSEGGDPLVKANFSKIVHLGGA